MFYREREQATGDLEGIESLLEVAVPAAISAGASVGSSFIQADAVKYAAGQQEKTAVLIALAQAKTEQAAIDAQLAQSQGKASTVDQTAKYALIAFGLWLAFGR